MNLSTETWPTIAVSLVVLILAAIASLFLAEMASAHLLLPSLLVVGALAIAGYKAVQGEDAA